MSAGGGALGVLGGTFDPVHAGHIAVAGQARQLLALDRVILVPSHRPPHRQPPRASPEHRLEMARLAAAGEEGLVVDDLEIRRGGVSYTVDTLRELRRRFPNTRLVLLIGQDAALEFESWHQREAIGDLAQVAVFNRSGSVGVPNGPSGLPPGAVPLQLQSPDISATAVRAALAQGRDLAGILLPSVMNYIRDRGLYAVPTGGDGGGTVIIPPE